jgi:hypothetical protein
MKSYAVSFAPIKLSDGRLRRYPLLPALLEIKGTTYPINFLIDSGSDNSLLPRALVQQGFGIHIEDIPQGETQQGLGGTFPTGVIEGVIRFGPSRSPFSEKVLFNVSRDATVEPNFCLLGREPFFMHYRIDFRMGWRKKGPNGKFTIYPEKNIR